jgi:hypothetical protein
MLPSCPPRQAYMFAPITCLIIEFLVLGFAPWVTFRWPGSVLDGIPVATHILFSISTIWVLIFKSNRVSRIWLQVMANVLVLVLSSSILQTPYKTTVQCLGCMIIITLSPRSVYVPHRLKWTNYKYDGRDVKDLLKSDMKRLMKDGNFRETRMKM